MSGALAVVDCLGPFGDHYLPMMRATVESLGVAIVARRADAPATAEPVIVAAPRDSPELRAAVTDEVRWIHSLSTGMDGFPLELARGRTLTCSRGSAAVPIAEYVLAAMLDFEKHLGDAWITAPPAGWQTPALGTLEGKTVAILGLGAIGTEVATRALAFAMRVVALRRSEKPSPVPGVELVPTMGDLLAAADHLVITAPATPETEGLLNGAAFRQLKAGAHVVNVSRGSLVDHDALLAALARGQVARATLDVVHPEPLPAGHPLYQHPNVLISPHISWAAPTTDGRVVAGFTENLRRYLNGQALEGVVDVDLGY